MNAHFERRPPRLLLLLAGAAAVVVCLPLAYLLIRVGEGGLAPIRVILSQPRVWQATLTTVLLASAVAAAAIALGVPAAWLITRSGIWGRSIWAVLVVLPLAVPSFVAAYSWVSLFPGLSGFAAAWMVLTAATVPYVVLPTAAALRGLDSTYEEVARTLGCSRFAAFVRVALPQLTPAVGGGVLLASLYVLSDFGAVSIFRVDTLSRVIYESYRASFDRTAAAVTALLLAVLAITVVWVEQSARGRAQRWRIASGAPRRPRPVRLPRWARLASYLLLSVVTLVGLVVPIVATARQLLIGTSAKLDLVDLGGSAATTFGYGLAGMSAALVLALPIGIIAARYPSRSARTIERLSYIGHALPGVVVGLSIVYLGIRTVPFLYQTVPMLALAYAVLFLPKAVAAIRGSAAVVPPALEEVARSLGRSHLRAFITVTLRLATPGIAAGAVLILLTVMKELPATLMLRPAGDNTLATRLWSLTEIGAYAAAAPYSLSLIAIATIPALALSLPLTRTKLGRGGGAAMVRQLDDEIEELAL